MGRICISLTLCLGLLASPAAAGIIPPGTYKQVDVIPASRGTCPTCTVTVEQVTPHIIQIESGEDWVAFATYDEDEGVYSGFREWLAHKGGLYENLLFFITVTYDKESGTITLSHELEKEETYVIKYRPVEK